MKTRGTIDLGDFLSYLGDEERMLLERQIVRTLVLNAQASHMGKQGSSSARYPPAARESASAAVDEACKDDDLDRPHIVIEVDYFDPEEMSDQERRRMSSTISVIAESR
jgi:hypothetical protein